MGSQRTLPASQSAQRKQQSISSFFTPKAAHPIKRTSTTTSTDDNATESPILNGRNRIHLNVVDRESPFEHGSIATPDENEDASDSPPQSKRRKHNPPANGDLTVTPTVPSRTVDSELTGMHASGRSSRYFFSGSIGESAAEHATLNEEDNEERRLIKAKLHEKFVKKLGRPDSIAEIKRRNRLLVDDSHDNENEPDDEEDAADEEAATTRPAISGRRGATAKKGKDKLTPMEKQVLEIKRKHMDTVLVVEVGYKFRFFGEDARIAARELSIVCIPGKLRYDEHPSEAHLDRFASASIPVHRLHFHVKRLVSAGHKVGVVRQLETAALKKAGDNRNSTFERGLTNLYTKGTYIDDQEGLDTQLAAPTSGAPATGHILCLTETDSKGFGSEEKVQIGFVAVQPSTGDILYDDFEDGWMRSELETRLLHVAPCEFLIVGQVSKETEKMVQTLSGTKTNVFGDKARVERVEKPKTMAVQAFNHITKFYSQQSEANNAASIDISSSQDTGTLLDKIHKLSENATICLSAMITHLTDYGLQHVFDLTKYFQSFSARSHMLLNGNTLTSLEIYRNGTDHGEHGSLFWALDRTHTRFGQRLLRKWVGQPLLDMVRLDDRVTAVQELREKQSTASVDRIKDLLRHIKGDLERSLIRIYYERCTRPEVLVTLHTLQSIAEVYAHVKSPAEAGFDSEMINAAIASLPLIQVDVINFLEKVNPEAAKQDDKYNFFRSEHETEDMIDHKVSITAIEHDLQEFKSSAAAKLRKSRVDYVTVAGIDYLIEVDNTALKNVPASWAKISGTKKVSRFHAPEVVQFIRERDQHKEALANACDAAFKTLLREIGAAYQQFRDCVQSLATLDCLLSLAEVASQPDYCKPEFSDEIGIQIVGGRHPMVEQVLLNPFVPNDIHLSSTERAMLVTGPNMGGKSSYVRAVALIAIMAQIGSYVPAISARLGLLDAVFTRMGASDNMMKGESTFMVELSETSDILKQASPRSLVVLDELGRGTSTHDGVAIAQAVLHYLVTTLKSLTLFITHYQTLARMANALPPRELRNVHMKFTEQITDNGEQEVTFLYEVGEGVAHRSYGLNVARLAGLPRSVLDVATERSAAMELEQGRRRLGYLSGALGSFMQGGTVNMLEHITSGIEQL